MAGLFNWPTLALQFFLLCSMTESVSAESQMQKFKLHRKLAVHQGYPVINTKPRAPFSGSYSLATSERKKHGTSNQGAHSVTRMVQKRGAIYNPTERAPQRSHQTGVTPLVNNSDKLVNSTETSSSPVTVSISGDVTNVVTESTTDYSVTEGFSIFDLFGFTLKQLSFTKTLYLCEYIFSGMYGEYTSLPDSGIVYNNKSIMVIHSEKFLNVCSALYDTFNTCDKTDGLTFCEEENVLLLHHQGCERLSTQDVHFEHLLAATLFEEDEMCFQSVCDSSLRVLDTSVHGIIVRLILPGDPTSNASCSRYLQHYFRVNSNGSIYATKNLYWSTYYPGYIVLWLEDPQKHGLFSNWSYLPEYCRVIEIIFTVIIGVIVTWGFVGNVVVLVVRLMTRANEKSSVLQTSLATSDLLVNTIVLVPAFIAQSAAVNDQNDDTVKLTDAENAVMLLESWEINKVSIINVSSGFSLFSALVMSTGSINSLLLLLILSFERFAVCRGKPNHKEIFMPLRVRIAVIISWALSLIFSLIIMYGNDGISSSWNSFSKLPLGLTLTGPKAVLFLVMIILGIFCLVTIGFSSSAAYYNHKRYAERAHQSDSTEETEVRKRQNRRITSTLIIMTVYYFLTVLSGGTAAVIHTREISFKYSELVSYVCWWIYFASTAWNPYLYNMRDKQFREMVSAVYHRTVNFGQRFLNTGLYVTETESSRGQTRAEENISHVPLEAATRNNDLVSGEQQVSYREHTV